MGCSLLSPSLSSAFVLGNLARYQSIESTERSTREIRVERRELEQFPERHALLWDCVESLRGRGRERKEAERRERESLRGLSALSFSFSPSVFFPLSLFQVLEPRPFSHLFFFCFCLLSHPPKQKKSSPTINSTTESSSSAPLPSATPAASTPARPTPGCPPPRAPTRRA